ncbi:MAG: PilZ domain-containing protein, partial [Spirochaetes bacterium]|nr:PilZ domain-containing protein [Spirochaetota bacterium]
VLSYTSPHQHVSLVNMSGVFEARSAAEGDTAALKYIEEIRKADARNFIVSYLMSPVTLFGAMQGYVRVETNQFDKKYINPTQAVDLHRLMELFSYAMSKTRIRSSHFDPSSVETRVVNISLSGLLLEFSDEAIFRYLMQHRRIKMLIPVMGDDLELYGEIVRFSQRGGFYYLGVLFFKSKPGDMIRLERFIHENMQFQFL